MELINTRLSPVIVAFAENKTIQSVVRGMVGVVLVTFLGAIFLLLLILGNYWKVLGAVTPANLTGYFLILGMLGFYVAAFVGICYARIYNLNQLTAAMISIMAFFTVILTADENATLPSLPGNFCSVGVFPALIVTFCQGMAVLPIFLRKS